MSSFSGYKTTAFKETQKFFVLDPATGSPSFVQGSDLVSYLRPSLNSVDVEITTDAAVNADYDVGKVIQTTGESSPGDGNPGLFLVVAAGAGGIPMLNGNELLVLEGANTAIGISYDNTASGYSATNVQEAIDNFALNTAGEGSDLIAHTGTSDTVTEALDKRTIFVGSVAELAGLSGLADGQEIDALGFYAAGDGGDCKYFWDASMSPSDHDGIRNCAKAALEDLGSDQVNDAFFNWSGSEVGGFIRVGEINLESIGGNQSALKAYLASEETEINLGDTKQYTVDETLHRIGKDTTFNFNGSRILFEGGNAGRIVISGGYENIQNVSATTSDSVTVPDASLYKIGDILKVVDEQDNTAFSPSKHGEFVQVKSISLASNVVFFERDTYYSYSSTDSCRIGKLSDAKVKINDLNISSPHPDDVQDNYATSYLFVLEACLNPKVNYYTAGYLYNSGLNLRSCYQGEVRNVTALYGLDATDSRFPDAKSYAVRFTSCENTNGYGITAARLRHAVVFIGPDGGSGVLDSGLTNYGDCANSSWTGGNVSFAKVSSFDFHHGARNCHYHDCHSYKSLYGFSVRGIENQVHSSCTSNKDFRGVQVFVQSGFTPFVTATTEKCRVSAKITNPTSRHIFQTSGVGDTYIDCTIVAQNDCDTPIRFESSDGVFVFDKLDFYLGSGNSLGNNLIAFTEAANFKVGAINIYGDITDRTSTPDIIFYPGTVNSGSRVGYVTVFDSDAGVSLFAGIPNVDSPITRNANGCLIGRATFSTGTFYEPS